MLALFFLPSCSKEALAKVEQFLCTVSVWQGLSFLGIQISWLPCHGLKGSYDFIDCLVFSHCWDRRYVLSWLSTSLWVLIWTSFMTNEFELFFFFFFFFFFAQPAESFFKKRHLNWLLVRGKGKRRYPGSRLLLRVEWGLGLSLRWVSCS